MLTNAMDPRYVRSGHLLFMRQGTLMAVAFDPDRVEVEGQPVIVLEDVMQALDMPNTGWETGAAQVAVSASGHLAYASGGVYPGRPSVLMRVPPGGDPEPFALEARGYGRVRGSPEGDRLAFAVNTGRRSSIFVHDLVRGTTDRLNTGDFSNSSLAWSPDGVSIAFSSDREGGVLQLYRMAVDGSGAPERMAASDQSQQVSSWSSEGVLAYLQAGDIWLLPPDEEPALFFTSDAREVWPSFSPDGRWLAYGSNQTGQLQIYVRPHPGPGPATLVSGDIGSAISPSWSRDGRRIYFLDMAEAGAKMMVAEVLAGDEFRVGRAEALVDPWPYNPSTPVRRYDVLADGSFVVSLDEDNAGDEEFTASLWLRERMRYRVGELHVVLNFFEELRERVPD